jgi:hypothetical protein
MYMRLPKNIYTHYIGIFLSVILFFAIMTLSWNTETNGITTQEAVAKKKRKKKKTKRRSNAGPFAQGNFQLSIGGGTANSFGSNYVILGGSVGYFVIDGLAPSLGFQFWIGDEPSVTELTPGVNYYLYQVRDIIPLIPYIGTFFEKTWIGKSSVTKEMTVNAYGGRVGALYSLGRLLIGGGIRTTYLMDCDKTLEAMYGACEDIGPELSISFSL